VLQDRLLVQATAEDARDVALLADHPGSGLVLTGKDALSAARSLHAINSTVPILIDRRRYAGRRRVPGVIGFDPGWIEAQRELRVASVLTDSGYVGRADTHSLRAVLGQASQAGPDVTAVLPLHTDWLHHDLAQLCQLVADHGVPVAVVLEHRGGPLSAIDQLYGLTTVLGLPVPVALLGSDVSALGALAFGAAWAAVGVRTGSRLLRPVTGAAEQPGGQVSALVDPALAMVNVQRIAAGWAATQDDLDWICGCSVCAGRTMDWMLVASRLEASTHTVERLLERRDGLVSLPPGSLRRQSWRAQCASAEFRYRAMALAGAAWDVPGYLQHWQRL
jgi:hypothetical protein